MHVLWNQLERAARLRKSEPAITCGEDRLNWFEALDRAGRIARVLHNHGVRDGARVAFISPNNITYMLMTFAAEAAGGVFAPVNSRFTLPEIVEQLEDLTPTLLIAAAPFIELAREAAERAAIPFLAMDAGGDDFNALVAAATPLPPVGRPADEPVAIFYTGGTTGRGKGVILTNERLVQNALQWAYGVSARNDERLLVVAPMFHMVAALNAIITAVLGCNLTILDRFTPEGALATIAKERVTNLALVPAMIDMLLAADGFSTHDLSSLRMLTYGGSPITQTTLARALDALPQVRLYQVYGQTEGGPTISVLSSQYHSTDPTHAQRLRSAGQPLPLTDIRIVHPDHSECATGEAGEITVRGPTVSPGYWNRPDETATAIRDGWLHTGDAGYLDEDGFLFIVGRIKEMIVTGGENVYAAEVERVVLQHDAVEECAVVGIPSERWGEAVHAIVRLRAGATADEAGIIAFCRARISAFKSPRSVSFPQEPFPLTAAGKVDKRALRARFW